MELTDEQIDKIRDEMLEYSNGRDYYDYSYEDHWWGGVNGIREFARAILKQVEK